VTEPLTIQFTRGLANAVYENHPQTGAKRHLELDALLLSLVTFLLMPTVIDAAPARLKTQNVFSDRQRRLSLQEVFNGGGGSPDG